MSPRPKLISATGLPVVRKITVDGQTKLRMYYSMPVNKPTLGGNQGIPALIGMCESTDPDNGVWEDKGFVTCSSSDMDLTTANLNQSQWGGFFYYNGIDPTYIVTPEGQHWLIHGSWHSGFAALQLNPSTGMPVKNTTGNPWTADGEDHQGNFGVNISTRSLNNRWQASEVPRSSIMTATTTSLWPMMSSLWPTTPRSPLRKHHRPIMTSPAATTLMAVVTLTQLSPTRISSRDTPAGSALATAPSSPRRAMRTPPSGSI